MKRMVSCFCFSCSVVLVLAQAETEKEQAAEVPAVEVQQLSKSAYADKLEDNVSKLVVNNQNNNAWVNAYKAERYGNYSGTSRSISTDSQKKLDFMVSEMNTHIPNTFEFHYASYLNGNKSTDALSHLQQAHTLNPSSTELHDDMLANAVIEKNESEKKDFAQKLSEGKVYSGAELEYNRNVLASVSVGAVLITYGNVDTYPLIISQEVNGLRKDIKIVCLDWLGSSAYRDQVAVDCGVAKNKITSSASLSLAEILAGSPKKIFVALTLPPNELKKYADKLYLTGLALMYSNQSQSNLPDLASKWEVYFSKTHLADNEALNRNYILPLIQLSAYYDDTGQPDKKKTVDDLAKQLALSTTNPSKVNQYLD
ncbi:MAG: hypothetical protein SH856_01720 [Flavobacteriales bacterium]|nr:hypothetical protein [Flavobacteriales bacterium]